MEETNKMNTTITGMRGVGSRQGEEEDPTKGQREKRKGGAEKEYKMTM